MIEAIQRRTSSRNDVSGLIRVRPSGLVGLETVCATENFSSDGIYFVAKSDMLRQRTHLLISFPHNADSPAAYREWLVEVVRMASRPGGRLGVAARLLNGIRLRLCDGLIVPEIGYGRYSWPHIASEHINVYA
jgi:hypothetical protein